MRTGLVSVSCIYFLLLFRLEQWGSDQLGVKDDAIGGMRLE